MNALAFCGRSKKSEPKLQARPQFFILHFSFLILVTGSHPPQSSLSHFGASDGAILSLSLVKEKELPKKEKVAWASDTAKEGQPFPRGTRKPSVISPTVKSRIEERKAIRTVRFYGRNSFFISFAFNRRNALAFCGRSKKANRNPKRDRNSPFLIFHSSFS